ncbi:hypothetical protein TNCV_541881 [Trichonephila clavipes]|nr:hypothetical protein TNCV_541881 [Trichonephila clavipes]
MATGSYLTSIYSRSQSEVQGDHHKVTMSLTLKLVPCFPNFRIAVMRVLLKLPQIERESTLSPRLLLNVNRTR